MHWLPKTRLCAPRAADLCQSVTLSLIAYSSFYRIHVRAAMKFCCADSKFLRKSSFFNSGSPLYAGKPLYGANNI